MNWSLLFTTYFLIFLMELPDKTALSILLLSTNHDGFGVFVGAAAAFVIQSFVAVTFGTLLAMLPPHITHIAAGILFLYFAFRLWQESREKEEEGEEATPKKHEHFRQSVINSFLMIFIAEWGDLTQLATAALQVKYHDLVPIVVGAILALWSVTVLSIVLGRTLKKWLDPQKLHLAGAVVFAGVGIYFLISAANASWL